MEVEFVPYKKKKRIKRSTRVKYKKLAIEQAKFNVRTKAHGICEKCIKRTKVLHGAHVQSVRHEATCADEDNLMALCYHCHFNVWHKYPLEAAEWFEKKWPGRYKRLQKKAQSIVKYTDQDWKGIYEKLKEQSKNLSTDTRA